MYDNPVKRHRFGVVDFGGGADVTHYITGPIGKQGTLVDFGVEGCVEAFAAGTALPQMAVGISGDTDAYGEEFSLGALAVAAGGKSVLSTHSPHSAAAAAVLVNRAIAKDVVTHVTCIAGTGSGLTGQAIPWVDIAWEK